MVRQAVLPTRKRRLGRPARIAAGGMLLALLALIALLAIRGVNPAGRGNRYVIAPDSIAYGRSYGEWSAAWEQWADSIPVAVHPLFDNGDCSQGQSGPVWFLGAKMCAEGANCAYTGVVRHCSVPAGKALYFPVLDDEDSALEESLMENPGNPAFEQTAALRGVVAAQMDAATSVSCSVDGALIPDLMAKFRVQSSAFGFTLPGDNLFAALHGNNSFVAGTYFPGVDDGWFVMLAPLPPGSHVLRLQGGTGGFALDVTYYLHVQK